MLNWGISNGGIWWLKVQQSHSVDISKTNTPHLIQYEYYYWRCSYWLWLTILAYLDKGGKDAHQLAETKGCMICLVRIGRSWQCCEKAPSWKPNGYSLHKEDTLPCLVLGEPWVVVSSNKEKITNTSTSVAVLEDNVDVISRSSLQRFNFKLASLEFSRICQTLSLAHFGCLSLNVSHQVSRCRAVNVNAVDYYCYSIT